MCTSHENYEFVGLTLSVFTNNYMLNMYQIFNDNLLKIRVKRCVRTAIKLRRKYLYKVVSSNLALGFDIFSCSMGSFNFSYEMASFS